MVEYVTAHLSPIRSTLSSSKWPRVETPDIGFEEITGADMRSGWKNVKRVWMCGGRNAGKDDWIGNGETPEIKEIAGAKGSRV
jgi:hypothetical protein